MLIIYYVIAVGGTLLGSILYMNKFWTEERMQKYIEGESE